MVEKIQKDRAGGNPTTQHYGLEYIKNIKENNNMIDIWQKQNPPPPQKNTPTLII